MEQLSIKIKIADREYPMKVSPEDEELVRKAGKLLNDKLRVYRTKFGIDDKQDLLSMVAFDVLIDNLQNVESTAKSDEGLVLKIRNINRAISEALT